MRLVAILMTFAACAPRAYHPTGCAPRAVDPEARCDRPLTDSDHVTFFGLNGPDTSGDQGGGDICMGLLLEIQYASGAHCTQAIASANSIGILGGDAVYVDDRPACLHLERDVVEVRRDGAIVARARRHRGMERAASFPPACD